MRRPGGRGRADRERPPTSAAEGWLDACVCLAPKPWDVAAGVALCRERGRDVLGADGRAFAFGSPVLAAGAPEVARSLAGLWEG
ncbi:inositol monophosphatase family protein [Streptomyces sp. I6]|uniref:inositol monophosphatase family protein n=1 Tax=Streptomyces sp. I6 TaxID=2483113 RepID=UPI0037D994D7